MICKSIMWGGVGPGSGSADSLCEDEEGRRCDPARAAEGSPFDAAGVRWRRPRRARAHSLVPRLPRPIWILQAGAFANALGSGLVLPFVLIYLHTVRGLTLGLAGLVVGSFGFAAIAATPVAGTLVDRLGARTVLRGSLLVLALGYGLLPLVRAPWEAFAFMAVAGIGNGGFWPSQSTLVMGLAPVDSRHQVSAVSRTVYNLGLGFGAGLGGLLVAGSSASQFTLLFILDALTFVAFAAVTTLLPAETHAPNPAGTPKPEKAGYRAVLADRIFMCILVLNVVYVACAFAPFEAVLPVFARSHLGLSPGVIGLAFLANMFGVAALQLPAAKLLEGRRRMLALAAMTVTFAAAFALIAGASMFHGAAAAAVIIVAAAVFAAGECLLGPAQGPLVVELAPAPLRGRYMALLTSSYAVGFAIGPPAAASILAVSPRGLWLAAAAVVLAAGAAGLALERRLAEQCRRTPSRSH
jgi:MFS family permease